MNYLQTHQQETEKYARRAADWRNGAIVYQVIVDRFAPAANLDAKKHHYAAPRRLHAWSDSPSVGRFLPDQHVWEQELDFWGGDLASLASRLDYVRDLGADVLYLNPIHAAFTNHKYDASDYLQVSPEYGSWADLEALISQTHRQGMKLVLDGVFNHVGRRSALFQQAANDPASPYRDWFYFGSQFPEGVRLWANAHNLPELNYENPAVQQYIYAAKDSVIRHYLRAGIDGWRLDTAFELGYHFLHELTTCAHEEKPGSLVVGEIWNYPAEWFPALDAVMNFSLRQVITDALAGLADPGLINAMIGRMLADAGIEPILKSWLLLDNHDVKRLTDLLPNPADRRLAQILQFSLPGAPNLYYGSELGMTGGDDPLNRAPMRWDLVSPQNETLAWTKQLIDLRKQHRALRIGDCRPILAHKLIAFERLTERVEETLLVFVNPSNETVLEAALAPDSRLMNYTLLRDLLTKGTSSPLEFRYYAGVVEAKLPPKTAVILQPDTDFGGGYTPYKRIP